MRADLARFDALLLTGGTGRRLGTAEKPALLVGGRPLAARAAAAAAGAGASRLLVVGRACPGLPAEAIVLQDDPPGGGPVAAMAAGLRHVAAEQVVVLAGDLPFVTAAAVAALRAALAAAPHAAAALPVDADGRDQPLCAAWRTSALAAALAAVGDPVGLPVRRLLEAAGPVLRLGGLAVDGSPPPWFDCDTPADLAQARAWTEDGRP